MKKILSTLISAISILVLTAVCFTCLAVSAPKTVSTIKYTSTASSVTLTWNNVKSTGYRVYRYNPSTKKWVKIVTTTKTSATVKDLKAGSKTIFAVKSYNKSNGNTAWAKTYTKITAYTRPANATGLKTSSKADSITITWSKTAGATGYRVYRYNPSTKKWDIQLKATSKTTATAKSLTSGKNYIFAVKPYYNTGNGILWASKYTQIKTSTLPAKVKGVKVSETMDGLKFTWTKVSGATGYNLLSYDASTKKYTNLGATTTNSINLTDYKGNKIYYFAVRAYKTLDKKVYYGERSAIAKFLTYPSEAQAAAIYNNAYVTAATWLDFGGKYVNWNDVKTYNGNRYVRINHSTINTKAKLKSYLCKYFTESVVNQAINTKVYSMDYCYRDIGGKLYKLEFIAGDAMPTYDLKKTAAYLVSMNGNNITFHIKTAYSFYGEPYEYESQRITLVKENNRWVVGTGDWRFNLYAPYIK